MNTSNEGYMIGRIIGCFIAPLICSIPVSIIISVAALIVLKLIGIDLNKNKIALLIIFIVLVLILSICFGIFSAFGNFANEVQVTNTSQEITSNDYTCDLEEQGSKIKIINECNTAFDFLKLENSLHSGCVESRISGYSEPNLLMYDQIKSGNNPEYIIRIFERSSIGSLVEKYRKVIELCSDCRVMIWMHNDNLDKCKDEGMNCWDYGIFNSNSCLGTVLIPVRWPKGYDLFWKA